MEPQMPAISETTLTEMERIANATTGAARTDKVVREALAFASSNKFIPATVARVFRERGDRLNEAFHLLGKNPDDPKFAGVDCWAMAAARDAVMTMAGVLDRAAVTLARAA